MQDDHYTSTTDADEQCCVYRTVPVAGLDSEWLLVGQLRGSTVIHFLSHFSANTSVTEMQSARVFRQKLFGVDNLLGAF